MFRSIYHDASPPNKVAWKKQYIQLQKTNHVINFGYYGLSYYTMLKQNQNINGGAKTT